METTNSMKKQHYYLQHKSVSSTELKKVPYLVETSDLYVLIITSL